MVESRVSNSVSQGTSKGMAALATNGSVDDRSRSVSKSRRRMVRRR